MSTKDWIEKDYYKVLGDAKDAKPEEIKKAYRKLGAVGQTILIRIPGNSGCRAALQGGLRSQTKTYMPIRSKRKEYNNEARRLFGDLGGFHSRRRKNEEHPPVPATPRRAEV